MYANKGGLWGFLVFCLIAVVPAVSVAEQKIVSGGALKALLSGKTVSVTHKSSGKQWKMYFSADGKSIRDNGDEGDWEISDSGQHCNTGIKLRCAKVADLGDGTYARLKPNGGVAVLWTKIEDGKHL